MTENELYHHGIKGMKWGVRRYQNEDGSYTAAGRKRYSVQDLKNVYSDHKDTIKKIGKVAAVTAAVGVSAYVMMHNKEATMHVLKNVGDTAVKTLSESSKRVGNAMIDAALSSMGGIAIAKLAKKLPTDDTVDEETRNRNQVIYDTAKAGIEEATKPNRTNNSSSNANNNSVGKEVSDRLGAPSKKGIDRQSVEYQKLFKDSNGNQRDQSTRSTIKSLAAQGYDIDQINEYLRGVDDGSIRHSSISLGYFAVMNLFNEGAGSIFC